jgi:hypothetical protein
VRNFVSDRHPASRQSQDENIFSIGILPKLLRQQPPRVGSVFKEPCHIACLDLSSFPRDVSCRLELALVAGFEMKSFAGYLRTAHQSLTRKYPSRIGFCQCWTFSDSGPSLALL